MIVVVHSSKPSRWVHHATRFPISCSPCHAHLKIDTINNHHPCPPLSLAKLFPPNLGGGFQASRQEEAARNNILPTTTTPREDHEARDGRVMNRVAWSHERMSNVKQHSSNNDGIVELRTSGRQRAQSIEFPSNKQVQGYLLSRRNYRQVRASKVTSPSSIFIASSLLLILSRPKNTRMPWEQYQDKHCCILAHFLRRPYLPPRNCKPRFRFPNRL